MFFRSGSFLIGSGRSKVPANKESLGSIRPTRGVPRGSRASIPVHGQEITLGVR